jgi:hypothetical protein
VPRETWLDPARRPAACAAQLADAPREYKAPVHFCLLNADTERLCQRLTAWRADVRAILCRAAGTWPRRSSSSTLSIATTHRTPAAPVLTPCTRPPPPSSSPPMQRPQRVVPRPRSSRSTTPSWARALRSAASYSSCTTSSA